MIRIEIDASLGAVVQILKNCISDLDGGALDLNEAQIQTLQDDDFEKIGFIEVEI